MIPNGPTFSVDGKHIYHTHTTERTVYRFEIHGGYELSHKSVFYQIPEGDGYPDGMTIDSEGCLWICHFAGSQISRVSPAGKLIDTIKLPVSNITSCTFGGENLDQLFITTARWTLTDEQLKEQPLAGGVFLYEPGVKGMLSSKFGP